MSTSSQRRGPLAAPRGRAGRIVKVEVVASATNHVAVAVGAAEVAVPGDDVEGVAATAVDVAEIAAQLADGGRTSEDGRDGDEEGAAGEGGEPEIGATPEMPEVLAVLSGQPEEEDDVELPAPV